MAEPIERHVISLLDDNEPGVLARVVGLFSGRGYNIESLTVAEVESGKALSRINLVTSGSNMIIEQIKAQLDRLVPIHKVSDLTEEGAHVERELALVKILNNGEKRLQSLKLVKKYQAVVIDNELDSLVLEIVSDTEKVDSFIRVMEPLGLVEISRTGVVAILRGKVSI